MTIIHGNTAIEYGLTPGGQFFELHQEGKSFFARITPDPERFLRWIIQSEVDREMEDRQRRQFVRMVSEWWEKSDGWSHRGQFNAELYYRIVEAKRQNGTL